MATKKKPSPYAAIEEAVDLARQGDVAAARPMLEELARGGNIPAAAALAALLAFEHEHAALVPFAAAVLREPRGVASGNVQSEMMFVLLCAGHATGAWQEIRAAVEGSLLGGPRLDHLRAQCEAGGALEDPSFDRSSNQPEELRRKYYSDAIEAAKKKHTDPVAYSAYAYQMAISYFLDDAIAEHYPVASEKVAFHDAIPYFALLVRQGRGEEAWAEIVRKLPSWSRVDKSQIAPIQLLEDVHVRTLMTKERCAQVLTTPRARR